MSTEVFKVLIARGLQEKVKLPGIQGLPKNISREQVGALKLVLRAAKGDRKALRMIAKLLKDMSAAPPRVRFRIFTLDRGQVLDPDGNVLGPLTDYPRLQEFGELPKEWQEPNRDLRKSGRR